jgi:hypothetical protein
MNGSRPILAGLLALAGLVVLSGPTLAQSRGTVSANGRRSSAANVLGALNLLPENMREPVRQVLTKPTITAQAPPEEFPGRPDVYAWLLDHPDRASIAWQRLGVQAVSITDLGEGRWAWSDGQGSHLTWQTVWRSGEGRIWYAEGQAKAGAMLPMVPVRAVAILRHSREGEETGSAVIRQQVDVYLQTDSRAASLVTRMIGPAAPRMAEQGAEQLLLFFSLLCRHLDRHPEQTEQLLAPPRPR